MDNSIFKSDGFFWVPKESKDYDQKLQKYVGSGVYYLELTPYCINCRSQLKQKTNNLFQCVNCIKDFPITENIHEINERASRKWEGFKLKDREVYSLDLAPTHVVAKDEDDNFRIEARIGEKNGKRMAVVYFGEKLQGQTKKDYTQLFIDFEDEQIRFDKSNKNPMKLLGKLVAEFPESKTTTEKN